MTKIEITRKDGLFYIHTVTDAAAHTCAVIEIEALPDLFEKLDLIERINSECVGDIR